MRHKAAAAALAALMVPGAGSARADVPVRIGGSGVEDACGAVGRVAAVGVRGFLAVRAGPGLRFATRDRLDAGRSMRICEEHGPWLGVIYGTRDAACAVARPRRARHAYAGPCRQGWVYRRFVTLLAG